MFAVKKFQFQIQYLSIHLPQGYLVRSYILLEEVVASCLNGTCRRHTSIITYATARMIKSKIPVDVLYYRDRRRK